jgi:effector-binding domain-containing protein
MNKDECCPKFDPDKWEEKEFEWEEKKFVKDKVFTIFYMPMNFGKVITKLMKKINSAGAECPEWMSLSDHTSKWNMDLYIAVDKEVPGTKNVTISGKFISKVYEGPYKNTGKWCKDFSKYAKEKGLDIKKEYMWYTTCPKCAKKYGKNYVVIIGEIAYS